ncbi:MAG: hypothetical protein V1718_01655 [archaeon]
MDPLYLPIYIFAGVIILAAAIIVITLRKQKKRREDLKKTAGRFGFSYSQTPDPALFSTLQSFSLFKKGFSKKITNVIKGDMNRIHWTVFDYSYSISTDRSSSTYNQTVACAEMKDTNLPHFTLGPESFFHKLGDIFGYKDINFENYPVFSKRYLLKGPDEKSVRDIFTPETLSYFESRAKPVNFEADGSRMIIYDYSKTIAPENIHAFIDESSRIAGLFKKDTF